jgi:hypothetical protein
VHGCDPDAIEQIKHEVEIVLDDLSVQGCLTDYTGTAWVKVEGAVRNEA